ncbi:hypothetical protein KEM54_005438, partial [Ascosphaera aggregata]
TAKIQDRKSRSRNRTVSAINCESTHTGNSISADTNERGNAAIASRYLSYFDRLKRQMTEQGCLTKLRLNNQPFDAQNQERHVAPGWLTSIRKAEEGGEDLKA